MKREDIVDPRVASQVMGFVQLTDTVRQSGTFLLLSGFIEH